ncbi:MAG: gliding motility-associated protein GldE [Bacteroidia bacterium]
MDPDPYLSILSVFNPLTFDIAASIAVMVVLLVCSALISGSENAFFSFSKKELENFKSSNHKADKNIHQLMNSPKELLATILISNNFVNISIVILSTLVLNRWINTNEVHQSYLLFVQIVVVTFMILLIGEIMPKVYASNNGLPIARFMAFPLMVLKKVLYLPNKFLLSSTSFIDKRVKKKGIDLSVNDLEHVLELTHDDDTTDEEKKILEGIVKFGNTDVKQIMISRMDMFALDIETPYKKVIEEIVENGFSRVPVYEETSDNVKGILYIKDLLPHLDKQHFEWKKILRQPFFVPENKKIDDLLKDFQTDKIHIAVVVDEYGGTSGIVTLEDVIEEIIGDISDEFDDDNLMYSKIDDYNYVFEGKTTLVDLYKVLKIDGDEFEEVKGEADSIAGFLIERAGKILLKGEALQFNNYIFTVEAADKRRIKRIKISIKPTQANNEN